jgi:hypothetical protein
VTIISRAPERAQAHKKARRVRATGTLEGVRVRWSAALPYDGAPPAPYCDLGQQPIEIKMHCETAVEEFIRRTGMRPTELTIVVVATAEIRGA